jgi:ATP-dependent DNA ligase
MPSTWSLNEDDLRREPLERRKATLAKLLARAGYGVRLNEHPEPEGPVVFEHACRMGLERIVSKRKGSWYESGRSRDWVKAKNPKAAVGGGGMEIVAKPRQETFELVTGKSLKVHLTVP